MRTVVLSIALVLAAATAWAADGSPGAASAAEDRPLPIPNAGEIIGLPVINPEGRKLGVVDDLVVGEDGQISYLVVRRGGFLGFGRKRVAIPWEASHPHVQENVLIVSLTEESLKGAPAFTSWDDFRIGDYPERVRAYFGLTTNPPQTAPRPIEGAGQPPPAAAPPAPRR